MSTISICFFKCQNPSLSNTQSSPESGRNQAFYSLTSLHLLLLLSLHPHPIFSHQPQYCLEISPYWSCTIVIFTLPNSPHLTPFLRFVINSNDANLSIRSGLQYWYILKKEDGRGFLRAEVFEWWKLVQIKDFNQVNLNEFTGPNFTEALHNVWLVEFDVSVFGLPSPPFLPAGSTYSIVLTRSFAASFGRG